MRKTKYMTLIIGAGKSGIAAQRLLQKEGVTTVLLDEKTHTIDDLLHYLNISNFTQAIISPGFPVDHPWINLINKFSIPLLSELELGWSRFKGRSIAITGSNGKSSVAKWVYEILKNSKFKVCLGGNFGNPVSELAINNSDIDWLVLEVSSFQLEIIQSFSPTIGVILNVLPNHLDRHISMENYTQIKGRIFGFPKTFKTHAILPKRLVQFYKTELSSASSITTFGDDTMADYYAMNGAIFFRNDLILDLRSTFFSKRHLLECSGWAVAAIMNKINVNMLKVQESAFLFRGLPHRFEFIKSIQGVNFINDSKSTNLSAMRAALESCEGGVHLLAGGILKEENLTFIKEILVEKVNRLYVFGEAAKVMKNAWDDVVTCLVCTTLEDAFNLACNNAEVGDNILLSPGCSSFDQYRSFEERGSKFKNLVMQWNKNCRS